MKVEMERDLMEVGVMEPGTRFAARGMEWVVTDQREEDTVTCVAVKEIVGPVVEGVLGHVMRSAQRNEYVPIDHITKTVPLRELGPGTTFRIIGEERLWLLTSRGPYRKWAVCVATGNATTFHDDTGVEPVKYKAVPDKGVDDE